LPRRTGHADQRPNRGSEASRPSEPSDHRRRRTLGCKISRKEDFLDLYASRFYFGCEADDPINAWAFNRKTNPMGARLNALFSSDIGHFDVPDMTAVVPEAYELVEHGLLDDDDFRDFMFANAVRFWGEVNPDFFMGTVVEKQAAAVLAGAGRKPC
jgi:hypothetical protein